MIVGAALASLLALASAPQDDADGLWWRAPAQCPTAATMAARAEALGGSARDARIEIVEIPGGFEATIERAGQLRTLQSPSCDELATAIALSFVGGATPTEPPTEPEPLLPEPQHTETSPGTSSHAPTRTQGGADRPRDPARRRHDPAPVLGPAIALSTHAGWGLLKRFDVGGGGAFAWRGRRWAVEIGGLVLAPNRVQRASIDARASLAAASVAGCGRVSRGWFELRPCGGAHVGASLVRTRGIAVRPHVRNAWVAVHASLRTLGWVHERVAVAVGVGVVVPLRQTEYSKSDASGAKTIILPARPAAFAASLGLEVAIGSDRRSR